MLWDWSTNENSNGGTLGTNIAENCPPGNLNDAIRKLMAQIRAAFSSALAGFFAGTSPLPVANGGTNATTGAAARTNIGAAASGANSDITSLAGLTSPVPISGGGTGAASAAAALAALGGLGINTFSDSRPGYIRLSNGLMLAWGTATANPNGTTTITFPLAFAAYSTTVCSGSGGSSSAQDNPPGVTSSGVANFTVFSAYDDPVTIFWIAIGR